METKPNCPFYGRHMYVSLSRSVATTGAPFVLMNSRGNQCGLQAGAYTPCLLETNHSQIEWAECPIVKDVLID